jgi:hypothetical protein
MAMARRRLHILRRVGITDISMGKFGATGITMCGNFNFGPLSEVTCLLKALGDG